MSDVRLGRYVERHGKIVRKARALESSGTRCLEKETSSREGEGDCTMPEIVRETEVRGGREGKWGGGLLSGGRSQDVVPFFGKSSRGSFVSNYAYLAASHGNKELVLVLVWACTFNVYILAAWQAGTRRGRYVLPAYEYPTLSSTCRVLLISGIYSNIPSHAGPAWTWFRYSY